MSAVLKNLHTLIPYSQFMGIGFELNKKGELEGLMRFQPHLIGNPLMPALHGGGISGFMEATAIASLVWSKAQEDEAMALSQFPRTINITTDYLRPGLTKDSHAIANIRRMGRRYASVHVLAWQDDRASPIAECNAHFLVADWTK